MTVDIRPLDRTLLRPAFTLATQVFIAESTLHRALGVRLSEYRDYLRPSLVKMVGEGLSVAATDRNSGKLVGCLIATDFHHQISGKPTKHPKFAPMAALTGELTRQYTRKRSIGAGEVLLVDMGAMSNAARGQGVYQRMRDAVHVQARNKGYNRVVGELSSCATQHVVLNGLGHGKIAEAVFETFEFGGERPFRAIEQPLSIILAEGEL